eukprot:CAMPEP_0197847664 /NCGR_PEP_ID=MMETSP1438-20131217/6741_1 /TAXON_ID=1461541 /ORGANISM="Pterosperma sp., Strain CCMP1384" /LENGTH=353 /DNA_ID=CAMNT_0043459653 /DNA_START=200 /DNA_END=1261 /DNA_ORIENTATION=+
MNAEARRALDAAERAARHSVAREQYFTTFPDLSERPASARSKETPSTTAPTRLRRHSYSEERPQKQIKRLPTLRTAKLGIDELVFGNCSCLFEAAANGRIDEIQRILTPHKNTDASYKPVDIDAKSEDVTSKYSGMTALMIAVSVGDERCVKELLRFGADVQLRDDETERSAIHMAAQNGHYKILQDLLNVMSTNIKRAEVKRKDVFGWTAVILARMGALVAHTSTAEKYQQVEETLIAHGAVDIQETENLKKLEVLFMSSLADKRFRNNVIAHNSEVVQRHSKFASKLLRKMDKSRRMAAGFAIRQQMQQNGTWLKVNPLPGGIENKAYRIDHSLETLHEVVAAFNLPILKV